MKKSTFLVGLVVALCAVMVPAHASVFGIEVTGLKTPQVSFLLTDIAIDGWEDRAAVDDWRPETVTAATVMASHPVVRGKTIEAGMSNIHGSFLSPEVGWRRFG